MCELLAISSRHQTRLSLSLQTLAAHSAPGSRLRDGWGAAFYQGRDVALYREAGAASDSALVRLLHTEGPVTTLALSHIRRATAGEITLANTQPFVREMGGRMHAFAHNGQLTGIAQAEPLAARRFRPVGQTDSELAFCALLERLRPLWRPALDAPAAEAVLDLLAGFAAELRALGPANFLYTDGQTLFAHGHRRTQGDGQIAPPGLHMLTRSCETDAESLQAHGLDIGHDGQQITLLASVPLSDEAWQPLAEGELVAIQDGRLLARRQPPPG